MLWRAASRSGRSEVATHSVSVGAVVRDPVLTQQRLGTDSRTRSSSGGSSIRSTSGRSHVVGERARTRRGATRRTPSARACRAGCPLRGRVAGCAASCSRVIDAAGDAARRRDGRPGVWSRPSCRPHPVAGTPRTCRCGSGARSRRSNVGSRSIARATWSCGLFGVDVDPLGAAGVAQRPRPPRAGERCGDAIEVGVDHREHAG